MFLHALFWFVNLILASFCPSLLSEIFEEGFTSSQVLSEKFHLSSNELKFQNLFPVVSHRTVSQSWEEEGNCNEKHKVVVMSLVHTWNPKFSIRRAKFLWVARVLRATVSIKLQAEDRRIRKKCSSMRIIRKTGRRRLLLFIDWKFAIESFLSFGIFVELKKYISKAG